jgi:hypothetical protein
MFNTHRHTPPLPSSLSLSLSPCALAYYNYSTRVPYIHMESVVLAGGLTSTMEISNKVRTIRALPVDAGGRTYAGPDVVAS